MKWSAPGFTLDGKILLIMAAFKAHAALNFWRGQEIGDGSPKAGAMGQFGKLTSVGDLPPDPELDALIREAAALAKTAPAPRKTKHEPKPPPELHPEFAAALAKAPQGQGDARRLPALGPARIFRMDQRSQAGRHPRQAHRRRAIEWLSEGKRRHWKYPELLSR